MFRISVIILYVYIVRAGSNELHSTIITTHDSEWISSSVHKTLLVAATP